MQNLKVVIVPLCILVGFIFFSIYFGDRITEVRFKGIVAKIAPPANLLSVEEKISRKNQLVGALKVYEDYFSKERNGEIVFDYSNNNGVYTIGEGEYRFDTEWSKASDEYIHFYSDQASIKSVRLAKDVVSLEEVRPEKYNPSSRARTVGINQVAIFENVFGNFLAVRILEINDDTRGDNVDALRFKYRILGR